MLVIGLSASLLGPAAGVLTSVLWTGTSICFTAAGRRLGPTVVNATRIGVAIILLAIIHRLFFSVDDAWIPAVNGRQLLLLALSGVVGLSIGDQALFTAFVDIGPRLSNLLMTTAPVFATIFAWLVLGERLGLVALTGMGITIVGIAWVILERPRRPAPHATGHRTRGVLLAVFGAACQACGLMLSKAGMGHGWMADAEHLDPQAATLVRMVFAGVGVLPIIALSRARNRRALARGQLLTRRGSRLAGLGFTLAGTLIGPVLGVWMSLVAADATSVGIAQTLLSLTPIFILPYAAFVEREHVSVRAVVG
ncbi:MAG: DMT family transporter, partial [Phycisphaerales bacterium]|nr:DMT family transporter [Phycisphaerales bacterium]